MLKSRSFVKKTKRGAVVKVVREHYLRDDVWTGWQGEKRVSCADPFVENVAARKSTLCPFKHLLVPDTNVVLHQIDVLEFHGIAGLILLQTVLEEVKHRNLPVYKRIREQLDDQNRCFYVLSNEHHKDMYVEREKDESANDRNDRAIRVATAWCAHKFADYKVVLLTNDNANKEKASLAGLLTFTMRQYVESLSDYPELVDKLSQAEEGNTKRDGDSEKVFPEYLSSARLHAGIKSGKLVQGTYQAKRNNYLEGFMLAQDSDRQPILIQGRQNINRAVHDDIVAIEMLPENEWSYSSDIVFREDVEDAEPGEDDLETAIAGKGKNALSKTKEREPSGKVVGIIKRNWRPYCGILLPALTKHTISRIFVPAEKRVPRIRITTRQGTTLDGQRIVVSIDEWSRSSKYPQGHFVKALGPVGDKDAENEVLLLEHEIPHQQFSENVLKDLPSMPWSISAEERQKRVDLRDVCVCSVDPPGCTDIDDALHCRQLSNGNFEVGVHIADVTHFIRPGSPLDKEAINRGTTVYLVDRRIDMVPELLSSNLCSLRANEERLAMSCIWEMNEGTILQTKFHKTVIKSKAALTYEEAQLRIDDKSKVDEVTEALRLLNSLAKALRQKRLENGALVLASPEVRFDFGDESHDPINLDSKEMRETNHLVEEFMLLANISVATKIHNDFPDCAVLRRHQQPPLGKFDSLLRAAQLKGIRLEVDNGKALAQSLAKAELPDDPYFNTLLRILSTRCMMQALYFCSGTEPEENFYHYGLAASIYTHFTSPIRRYPDIMVHRLLAVAISADTTHPDMLVSRKVQELCNHFNHRHRMAQLAGRASVQLHTQIFFKGKVVCVEGYITSVQRNAISILIPRYGLETSLFLRDDEKKSVFTFNEQVPSQTAGSVRLTVFGKVKVRLQVEKRELRPDKLKVELVWPQVAGFNEGVSSPKNESKRKRKKVALD
ncbi:exosome complex exonuclease RRP44-like isoform X2 [Oscarella lobularis]|uniref:exosome complex exonuclease RRP44-like isoform X2 n=1 Tax=Oscarella lobularis TaxID=121494 RepID=UPI003313C6B5